MDLHASRDFRIVAVVLSVILTVVTILLVVANAFNL